MDLERYVVPLLSLSNLFAQARETDPLFVWYQGYDKAPVSFLTENKCYYANTPNSVAEPTAAHTVCPPPLPHLPFRPSPSPTPPLPNPTRDKELMCGSGLGVIGDLGPYCAERNDCC